MAHFYNSNYQQCLDNYHQNFDNYQYNHQFYNCDAHGPRYVQYDYDHSSSYYGNAYDFAVTPSIVGYHYNHSEFSAPKDSNSYDKNSDYYDQVTTQFVISYSDHKDAENDLDFEEYNPEPYNGGYDISETYGKALPPSDEICHPPSKIDPTIPSHLDDPSIFKSAPAPYGKHVQNVESVAKPKPANESLVGNVIQEEKASDFEEDDEEEEEDDEDEEEEEENREDLQNHLGEVKQKEDEVRPTNGDIASRVTQEQNALESEDDKDDEEDEDEDEDDEDEDEDEDEVEKEEEGNGGEIGEEKGRNAGNYGKEIRRQIPPGYGLEAMDLCEGLFGGYFPCLSKRNQATYNQNAYNRGRMNNYDPNYEYVQGTVDYLFGNPNPYGGSMPERGSYGDPIYSYQRHHPQQPISGQVQYYGENSSWMHNARYSDSHTGGYQ